MNRNRRPAARIAFAPTKTEWVPVGRDEVSLTHAEIREIAKDYNGYAVIRRGGYQYDAAAIRRTLNAKYADQELTMTDLRDIHNWYAENLMDVWNPHLAL